MTVSGYLRRGKRRLDAWAMEPWLKYLTEGVLYGGGALLLVLQTLAALFGWQLELGALQEKLLAAVNALFALLAVLGVVNDPTTAGLKDSPRALGYRKPE